MSSEHPSHNPWSGGETLHKLIHSLQWAGGNERTVRGGRRECRAGLRVHRAAPTSLLYALGVRVKARQQEAHTQPREDDQRKTEQREVSAAPPAPAVRDARVQEARVS